MSLIRVFLFIFLAGNLVVPEARADWDMGLFRLKGFHKQADAEKESKDSENADMSYRDKGFVKVFNLATGLEEKSTRNYYSLKRVIDTARIMLDSGEVIHMLGIMPSGELENFIRREPYLFRLGEKTADFNMNFVASYLKEATLRLRFPEEVKVDKEGFRYAYVFLDSGELFNQSLIESGQAVVSNEILFQDYGTFKQMEEKARSERRGIWR